jgi:hypothetical protein
MAQRDKPSPQPEMPAWRPVTGRQRLWLAVLTLLTVLGLVHLLQRPHQLLVAEKAARQAAACQRDAASRPAGCPGARMPVLVLPPAASAPR